MKMNLCQHNKRQRKWNKLHYKMTSLSSILTVRMKNLSLQWSGKPVPEEIKSTWEIRMIFPLICVMKRRCKNIVDDMEEAKK
jgi:hypothetical protein